jgi:chromosome partitioning protein
MKRISIFSVKGGTGKTTTAVNLAAALAQDEKRVLLIDLDPEHGATLALGIRTEQTLIDLLRGQASFEQVCLKVWDFDFIPSGPELMVWKEDVKTLKETVTKKYDYILADHGPGVSPISVSGLAFADTVLIPTPGDYLPGLAIERVLDVVKGVKEVNPNLRVGGIVLSQFDSRRSFSFQVESTLRDEYGELVFDTKIPVSVDLVTASYQAKPVIFHRSGSPASEAFKKLAREIEGRF